MIGIYFIVNKVTGAVYIGQSNNLRHRETEHFWSLAKNTHHCNALQTAFNCYGRELFEFHHLEYTKKSELRESEQFWMDYFVFLDCEIYNTFLVARASPIRSLEAREKQSKALTGRKYSEEHCNNISKARLGKPKPAEWRAKLALAQTGKKLSEETKAKMSESRTGKKHSKEAVQKRVDFHTGRKRSPETCQRISEAKLLKSKLRKEQEQSSKEASIMGCGE
jgi:group I intron endonuclease